LSLKDYVFLSGDTIYATMAGHIDYQWGGGDGQSTTNKSPFSINLPLVAFSLEMGEGSCEDEADRPSSSRQSSTALSLDRKSYQIHLPKSWNAKIAQGAAKSFDLTLSAPKSSRHKFLLVLQLSDGSQVASPEVDLSYFRPRLPKRK
jgi:hypothetical protein